MATKAGALKTALATDTTFVKGVRDVPGEVKEWVEGAYQAWLKDRTAWRSITFATAEDMENIMDDARQYTNVLRPVKLTVQTQGKPESTKDGVRVVYRVRDKVHSGRRPRSATNGS
jgi:hypothetical protein